MNKKIIVTISMVVAIACVSGLVGFNIYNNKKVEAQAQEQAAEQEMNDKPAVNEKDDNGNYVDPTATTTALGDTGMTVAEDAELQDFFDGCLRTMFNVEDSSNIPGATKSWEQENFDPTIIEWLNEDLYKNNKSVKLEKYNIQLIEKRTMTYNGTDVDGYFVVYTCNLNIDGKEDTQHDASDNSKATAIVIKQNNKFKFIEPNNPK